MMRPELADLVWDRAAVRAEGLKSGHRFAVSEAFAFRPRGRSFAPSKMEHTVMPTWSQLRAEMMMWTFTNWREAAVAHDLADLLQALLQEGVAHARAPLLLRAHHDHVGHGLRFHVRPPPAQQRSYDLLFCSSTPSSASSLRHQPSRP